MPKDAAGNKVQTCMPAVQKKATVLAARALKTKAQKNQIQTNIEKLRLNRLEQQLIERATEKVVHNVKQRLTATVATQTESPRAAPTKTVEVNLEKKVSAATQTVQLDDGWVSEPEIEQPMNEQPSVSTILARLCMLSEARLKPKSPPQVAQVVEPPMPPVPFETVNRKKRRGKKQKDKDANSGYM